MSMQREEILKRIAEIEDELKKRKESNRLNFYNTGRKKHKKQMAFHKCKKRNRWVFGGNRSGKTECGAVEYCLICGEISMAEMLEIRYHEAIDRVQRKKNSEVYVPPRRWI